MSQENDWMTCCVKEGARQFHESAIQHYQLADKLSGGKGDQDTALLEYGRDLFDAGYIKCIPDDVLYVILRERELIPHNGKSLLTLGN